MTTITSNWLLNQYICSNLSGIDYINYKVAVNEEIDESKVDWLKISTTNLGEISKEVFSTLLKFRNKIDWVLFFLNNTTQPNVSIYYLDKKDVTDILTLMSIKYDDVIPKYDPYEYNYTIVSWGMFLTYFDDYDDVEEILDMSSQTELFYYNYLQDRYNVEDLDIQHDIFKKPKSIQFCLKCEEYINFDVLSIQEWLTIDHVIVFINMLSLHTLHYNVAKQLINIIPNQLSINSFRRADTPEALNFLWSQLTPEILDFDCDFYLNDHHLEIIPDHSHYGNDKRDIVVFKHFSEEAILKHFHKFNINYLVNDVILTERIVNKIKRQYPEYINKLIERDDFTERFFDLNCIENLNVDKLFSDNFVYANWLWFTPNFLRYAHFSPTAANFLKHRYLEVNVFYNNDDDIYNALDRREEITQFNAKTLKDISKLLLNYELYDNYIDINLFNDVRIDEEFILKNYKHLNLAWVFKNTTLSDDFVEKYYVLYLLKYTEK